MRGGTKFARYSACPAALGASHVREHCRSETHKLAVAAYLEPDKPVRLLLQKSLADEQLLAGSVPQPADWLRAWRVCMNPVSWACAVNQAGTEHFIAQIRDRGVTRNGMKSMVCCMSETLRARKREWLDKAKWIFLGFDDKNGRKLLRFKCDTPLGPCGDAKLAPTVSPRRASTPSDAEFDAIRASDPSWLKYGARTGVVGCMPMGLGKKLEDYEQDYAERTSGEVLKLLERLCTPAGSSLDQTWFTTILDKVGGIVVDGALLKTARYMKAGRFRNIKIIMRDPAHIIRTSCRDPLHDAAVFKEQYDRLFGDRHAVLKDFMFSGTWQDQLEECQKILLEASASTPGAPTPCLKRILRHVAFIQPRFESFVTPRRRYVCLLRGLAMVLVIKAGDDRQEPAVRRRAEKALQAMEKSSDSFVAGLAGDYCEVCLEFLRLFDVHDHDPARAKQEVEDFKYTLTQLFIFGYVLCSDNDTPQEIKDLGIRRTLSQIAIDNMDEPLVLT